jgi:hypothetical protein
MSNPTMRAKFYVTNVEKYHPNDNPEAVTGIRLTMSAVSEKPFDTDGVSEDNSFARWSPSGSFEIQIANPNLFDKFEVGQRYYLDFTAAEPLSEAT